MHTHTLQDESESFQVSVHEAKEFSPVVLFAVGAGGNPERHVTLLDTLKEAGCTVVAPHFPRLRSLEPTEAELMIRARRICLTLDAFVQPDATAAGVGHSIGATILLALAGGQMWSRLGERIDIQADGRLTRLGLIAPPTGFFQVPGALDAVHVSIQVWVGSADSITPPAQSEWLAQTMRGWQTVNVRIADGAGHFSFMDQPPPHTVEPLQNKQAFLREFSSEICNFVHG